MSKENKNDSRLLLLLVCGKQVDPKATFSFGHVLGLHAAHQTSQQVQLLFGQRVGGVICLQQDGGPQEAYTSEVGNIFNRGQY